MAKDTRCGALALMVIAGGLLLSASVSEASLIGDLVHAEIVFAGIPGVNYFDPVNGQVPAPPESSGIQPVAVVVDPDPTFPELVFSDGTCANCRIDLHVDIDDGTISVDEFLMDPGEPAVGILGWDLLLTDLDWIPIPGEIVGVDIVSSDFLGLTARRRRGVDPAPGVTSFRCAPTGGPGMPTHHEKFWENGSFAFVGHSASKPFPALSYRELRKQPGVKVFAIDPSVDEIEGDRAYPDFASLPDTVEAAVLEVPRSETAEWVVRAADAGISNVWIHMGRETPEALRVAEERGLDVHTGTCAVMYVKQGFSYHSLHKWINQATGSY